MQRNPRVSPTQLVTASSCPLVAATARVTPAAVEHGRKLPENAANQQRVIIARNADQIGAVQARCQHQKNCDGMGAQARFDEQFARGNGEAGIDVTRDKAAGCLGHLTKKHVFDLTDAAGLVNASPEGAF